MLLLTIATVILAGGSLWAAVHYGRKAVSEARSANVLATERSVVDWIAGRVNDDPGRFRVVNVGEDNAYEVTVKARYGIEHVTEEADVVRPYRDEIDSSDERPHYVEFRLPSRAEDGPALVKGPDLFMGPEGSESRRKAERTLAEFIDGKQRQQVQVTVTWRSELGQWSTKKLRTG